MSEIVVRDLDDAVIQQLESRALKSGRSMQAELKMILEQAARPESTRLAPAAYRPLADQVRAALVDRPQADSAALARERGRS
jgi:plasmid stability protein